MEKMPQMLTSAAVERIAHDGVPEVFEVNPDLVGSPGAGLTFQECFSLGGCQNAVLGERIAPAFVDRHFLAVNRVAADRGFDFSVRHAGNSLDKSQVGFFDQAVGKLFGERAVGKIGFGNGQAAARFLVQAVNDPRSLDAADDAEAGAVEE